MCMCTMLTDSIQRSFLFHYVILSVMESYFNFLVSSVITIQHITIVIKKPYSCQSFYNKRKKSLIRKTI